LFVVAAASEAAHILTQLSVLVASEFEGQAGDFLVFLFRELVLQRRQKFGVHLQDEALDIFDDGL